jgi:hypothetical protein
MPPLITNAKVFNFLKNFVFCKLEERRMKRILGFVYLAAGLGFLASIIRDWTLVKYTTFSKDYFQLIYTTALSANFAINALTLRSNKPTLKTFFFYVVFSFCILFFIQLTDFRLSWDNFILASVLQFLWLIGTCLSKALLEEKKIFIARIRDAFTSLLFMPVVLINSSFDYALIIPFLFSTLIYFILVINKEIKIFSYTSNKMSLFDFFLAIFITNFTNSVLLLWALYISRMHESFLGLDLSICVRFSLYVFQFLSLSALVLTISKPKIFIDSNKYKYVTKLAATFVLLGLFFSVLWPKNSVLFMPVFGVISHYSCLIILNRVNNKTVRKWGL